MTMEGESFVLAGFLEGCKEVFCVFRGLAGVRLDGRLAEPCLAVVCRLWSSQRRLGAFLSVLPVAGEWKCYGLHILVYSDLFVSPWAVYVLS